MEEGTLKEQAMSALWNRYSQKLFRYCLNKSDNRFEAEDMHQSTWIKFYNYARSGNKINSIEKFLYNTAYMINLEILRNKINNKIDTFDSTDMEQFVDNQNFLTQYENENFMSQICIAVDYLDDDYKEIFKLKWFALLSFEEISQITHETIDGVKHKSYRAMTKVIQILKPIINDIS